MKKARTEITYRNLDLLPQYDALCACAAAPQQKFEEALIPQYDLPITDELRYNYSARLLSRREIEMLASLAEEAELIVKYRALIEGEYVNRSEDRMVLHHLLRGSVYEASSPIVDEKGTQMAHFYREERRRFADFSDQIRSGVLRNTRGANFSAVVQIGIGGSNLGPRALYEALTGWAQEEGISPLLPVYFIANVDPDDASMVLAHVDPTTTLFIVVSKSGATTETMINAKLAYTFLQSHGIAKPKKQMIAVTAKESPLAKDDEYLAHFFIDDHIGGRYSSSGAVGGVMLSLAFGASVFERMLSGAHAADLSAAEPDPLRNPVMLDALCGVYERTFRGYPTYAVLPYSQALQRFPAHIQQLDMESNGKSVNRFGQPINYQSGAIVFGEPGTNAQHSFYQLLHQGSTIVPALFIAFRDSQICSDGAMGDVQPRAQEILRANVVAQIVAFARGRSDTDLQKHFPGGRPSALLYGARLTPSTLGALLSFFENRVMFQGYAWNINSFDQEGVQLGKRLAQMALSTATNALSQYGRLLSNV